MVVLEVEHFEEGQAVEVADAGNLVPGKVDFLQPLVGEGPDLLDVVVGDIEFL